MMVTENRTSITVALCGGPPWGFRLQGGDNSPLEVTKIRKNSQSYKTGLKEGDIVLSINGQQISSKSHQSAMEIVDLASNQLVLEVARLVSVIGTSQFLDPQRCPGIVPMVSSQENTGSGVLKTEQAKFKTALSNTRTEVNTNEYVMMTAGDGRKIIKTVTEEQTARYPPGSSLSGMISNEYQSYSPKISPLTWRPPSQSNIPINQRNLCLSYSQTQTSPSTIQSTSKLSQGSIFPRGYRTDRRSWSPSHSYSKSEVIDKENWDPIMVSEQAKWETIHKTDTVQRMKLETVERKASQHYVRPRMNDPYYPMFELPQSDWARSKTVAQLPDSRFLDKRKMSPSVAPKPWKLTPSPIPFIPNKQPCAGGDEHYPGMISPPKQPETLPTPPPSRLLSIPLSQQQISANSMSNKFDTLEASTPKRIGLDKKDLLDMRPNQLPMSAMKVVFKPENDNGMLSSSERVYNDISLQNRYQKSFDLSSGTLNKEWHQEQCFMENSNPEDKSKQFDKCGNFNRRIKAWFGNDKSRQKELVNFSDENRQIKAWQEPKVAATEKSHDNYGDYKRRVKAWQAPVETSSKTVIQSVQNNYNSLPRGFVRAPQEHHQLTEYDL